MIKQDSGGAHLTSVCKLLECSRLTKKTLIDLVCLLMLEPQEIFQMKKKKKTIERRLSGSVYTVKDTQIICYWRTSGLIVRHVTLGNNAHKTLGKPTPCVHYCH